MDPLVTSTLISTGSQLLGGLLGKKKRGPSLQDQLSAQGQEIMNRFGYTMQAAKDFGIHPTVALGLNPGAGGMNVQLGDNSGSDPKAASLVRDIGQDVASAAARMQTPDQKMFTQVAQRQALERGDLENELLKTQIAQGRASITPGIANTNAGEMIAGQGDTGAAYLANQLVKHESADGKEGGTPASWTTVMTKMGPMTIPSKDFQDRAEDIPGVGWEWIVRNKLPEILESLKRSMTKPGTMGEYVYRKYKR